MIIVPPLYQTHLENQLSSSQLLFFSLIINVLQEMKSVSLEKLAAALPPFPWRFPPGAVAASPLPILFESRRKKSKDSYPYQHSK
jgi:hypothetical protein